MSGLRTYFNRSCRLLLLYPQERQQAEAVSMFSLHARPAVMMWGRSGDQVHVEACQCPVACLS